MIENRDYPSGTDYQPPYYRPALDANGDVVFVGQAVNVDDEYDTVGGFWRSSSAGSLEPIILSGDAAPGLGGDLESSPPRVCCNPAPNGVDALSRTQLAPCCLRGRWMDPASIHCATVACGQMQAERDWSHCSFPAAQGSPRVVSPN